MTNARVGLLSVECRVRSAVFAANKPRSNFASRLIDCLNKHLLGEGRARKALFGGEGGL